MNSRENSGLLKSFFDQVAAYVKVNLRKIYIALCLSSFLYSWGTSSGSFFGDDFKIILLVSAPYLLFYAGTYAVLRSVLFKTPMPIRILSYVFMAVSLVINFVILYLFAEAKDYKGEVEGDFSFGPIFPFYFSFILNLTVFFGIPLFTLFRYIFTAPEDEHPIAGV